MLKARARHFRRGFWTDQGNQPLPTEIVKRFKGKVIAITGYEMDQAWPSSCFGDLIVCM